jgi:hypothetical protein
MGTVALLSTCMAFAPALPSAAAPPCCGCRGFTGEFLLCCDLLQCWLIIHSGEPVPLCLQCWVVIHGEHELGWEPKG